MPSEEVDAEVRRALTRHFEEIGHWNAPQAAAAAVSLDGMRDRLAYVASKLPPEIFSGHSIVLISGMGAGGEMLVARERGAGTVYGVKVDPLSVELCRLRFEGLEGLFPWLYDGESLPFESASFDLVLSGHIIEHTRNPRSYLTELLRVLRPRGWLFLEFPTRFHWRELHTGLPSVEWLPRPVRNGILRMGAGRFSPLEESTKHKCRAIFGTELKQISTGRVRRWLAPGQDAATLADVVHPVPGVVRCLIRKGAIESAGNR
jgi:SAM-dependent methyltransferase